MIQVLKKRSKIPSLHNDIHILLAETGRPDGSDRAPDASKRNSLYSSHAAALLARGETFKLRRE